MLMLQIKEEKLCYGPNRYLYSGFFRRYLVLAAAICICHWSYLICQFLLLTGTFSELLPFFMLSSSKFKHRFSDTLMQYY